ncbi:MAG: 4-alpha-glucanotransferase [Bacillus sp. (in: firmicutes)]
MACANRSFQRTAGALLPIFSLPGPYGIGVLGKEARRFADLLAAAGLHCWQVLPTVQAGAGNSPYSGVSAFAGDPLYIDPETLYEKGLLTKEELEDARYPHSSYSVDYEWLLENKPLLLKKAYKRITPSIQAEIERFMEENRFWLYDYALYMTMQEKGKNVINKAFLPKEEEIALAKDDIFFYYCFGQYEFYSQWLKLKKYCNDLGVGFIGDLPFYVSYDSSDVWANPDLFMLDEEFEPIGIAGTPPDYFSEDGQCWGNPLYDWKEMKSRGYEWWHKRIAFHLTYNDALRIDHFRGFESFWSIPAKDRDAKKGHWETGPGLELFDLYEKKYEAAPIIAEDLGTVDEKLFAFVKKSGFPGMRVMQFAFDSYSDNLHLPHNYIRNTIAYTGTHDNNTTLGWIWEASDADRKQAVEYCNVPFGQWPEGGYHSPLCRGFLRTLYQSVSCIVIAPLQDFCGFGEDTRINIPGKATGNWNFRFTAENLEQIDTKFFLQLSETYKRNNPFKFIVE